MKNKISENQKWRIVSTAALTLWCVVCAQTLPEIRFAWGLRSFNQFFLLYVAYFSLYIVTAVLFAVLIFLPLRFELYMVAAALWGFYFAFSGDTTYSLLLVTFVLLFAWRLGWITLRRRIAFITSVLCVYALPVGISVCASKTDMLLLAAKTGSFVILAVIAWLLLAAVQNEKESRAAKVLDVTGLNLTERQVQILGAVLKGEKYDAIARTEQVSTITVKKEMQKICRKLNVCDKNTLVINYGGFTVTSAVSV